VLHHQFDSEIGHHIRHHLRQEHHLHQKSETDNLPAANIDCRVPLPKTQHINLDAIAKNSINDEDFDPELLTNEKTSCG
jgi:hypothetical protein